MHTTVALWQVNKRRFTRAIRLVAHTSTIADRLYYAWPVLWRPDQNVELRSKEGWFCSYTCALRCFLHRSADCKPAVNPRILK